MDTLPPEQTTSTPTIPTSTTPTSITVRAICELNAIATGRSTADVVNNDAIKYIAEYIHQRSLSSNDHLTTCAKLAKWIISAHVFKEKNSETAFLVMNEFLREHGAPCFVDAEPCVSLESVGMIRGIHDDISQKEPWEVSDGYDAVIRAVSVVT